MKIQAKAGVLAKAARIASKIIEKKPEITIIGCLKLSAGFGVEIMATNLDRDIRVTIGSPCAPVEAHDGTAIDEHGEAVVDAERFVKLLSAMDGNADVTITADDTTLTLQSGRSRYKLDGLPVADFPPQLEFGRPASTDDGSGVEADPVAEIVLDSEALERLFERPALAISEEETRYYLNGTFVTEDKGTGNILAVATDGHRLVTSDVSVSTAGEWPGIIIPRNTVKIITMAGDGKLSTDGKLVRITSAGFTITSKTIDGTFPDYRRVIPQPSLNILECGRKDLLAALTRIKAVARRDKSGIGAVKLAWTPNGLTLSLRNDQAEDTIACDAAGTGEVAFSIQYGIDLAENLSGDRIAIDVSDPGSPVRISDPGDCRILQILMPMRW